MKVYIIIESSGGHDTYHEYIHSIYLNLDKAESVKSELELKSAQIDKCQNCVCSGFCIPDCELDDCDNCDELRIKHAYEYCDNADPYINKWTQDGEEYERLECKNRIVGYSEDYRYRIEEKEVIE